MHDIEQVKMDNDILDVAARYTELIKLNSNQYKAKHNALRSEKTSSLIFYRDTQKWHDFGTGESGDVLDFIAKIENLSLSAAMDKLTGESYTTQHRAVAFEPVIEEPQVTAKQLQKEFDRFKKLDIDYELDRAELNAVIPYWLYKDAHKTDEALFDAIVRIDHTNHTLVAGWLKNTTDGFMMVTYKRRRFNGGKWINRKGTTPNQTAFARIHDDTKPVYIVEGMRDALTAIMLGLNFVAIPTTSYKNFDDLQQYIRPENEVIFICEDAQGYKAMHALSEQLTAKAKTLKTFTDRPDKKIDLSDYVMGCKSRDEVRL